MEAGSHLFTFAIGDLPPEAGVGGVQERGIRDSGSHLRSLHFLIFSLGKNLSLWQGWDSEYCVKSSAEE